LTRSLSAEPIGSQRPRVSSHPVGGISSSGREAVELAASAGLILDDWQAHVLDVSLSERRDHKWAAMEVGVIVGRQNGKGAILEARELAGLFLFDEALILHSAHEFKTAAEAFRRVLYLVQNTPDLERKVKSVRTSHGDEGIELRTGQRLRFIARSTGSGRGFSGDLVILDEAYNLPPSAMGALLPTLSARKNPQIWYTSSAGTVESEVLARLRERGAAGSPRLAYFEWSAEPGAGLDDFEGWQAANPGLGIRIDPDFIEAERAALPAIEFARERLGIWAETSVDVAIDAEVWAKLADSESKDRSPVAFSVEINQERTKSSIMAAIMRQDGLVQVSSIEYGPGTHWVLDRLVSLEKDWKPVGIGVNPATSAGSLIPELEKAGIEPVLITGREEMQACGAFFDAINESKIRHGNQPALNLAVDQAIKRPVGDMWVWHRRTTTDITPLTAATLAYHVLTAKNEPEQPFFASWR